MSPSRKQARIKYAVMYHGGTPAIAIDLATCTCPEVQKLGTTDGRNVIGYRLGPVAIKSMRFDKGHLYITSVTTDGDDVPIGTPVSFVINLDSIYGTFDTAGDVWTNYFHEPVEE